MLISEKNIIKRQTETCIVINDASQGNVATWLRCGGTVDYYFITNLLTSLLWKDFYNRSTSDKVTGKENWLPYAPGYTVLLKDELGWYPIHTTGRNCCSNIELRLILLNNLVFVIDKYQTGVMSTVDHLWLADWCHQWLNVRPWFHVKIKLF